MRDLDAEKKLAEADAWSEYWRREYETVSKDRDMWQERAEWAKWGLNLMVHHPTPVYGAPEFPHLYHEGKVDGRTLVPEHVARNLMRKSR